MITFRTATASPLLAFSSRRILPAERQLLRHIRPGIMDESIILDTYDLTWRSVAVYPNLSSGRQSSAYSTTITPEVTGGNFQVTVTGPPGCLNDLVDLENEWTSGYDYDTGDQRFGWRLGYNVNATRLIDWWAQSGKPTAVIYDTRGSWIVDHSEPFTPGLTLSEMELWGREEKPEKPEPVILNQRQLREDF